MNTSTTGMAALTIANIWTAAGLLLGFQVTSFLWRIAQEAAVADKNQVTWLPLAEAHHDCTGRHWSNWLCVRSARLTGRSTRSSGAALRAFPRLGERRR